MFEGQCKKRGSVWKDNCVSYKCHFNVTDTEDGPIYKEKIIPEPSKMTYFEETVKSV